MLSKLTLVAAVVAASDVEDIYEEESELHNHFVGRGYTRSYKFGAGWCGHAGAYVHYADIDNNHHEDQICSDTLGRHWTRLAYGNGSFAGTRYHANIYRWCGYAGQFTQFGDYNGDHKADMLCDQWKGGYHWLMPTLGNGYWNPHYTKLHTRGWCGHAGAYTQYADLNGDGKVDMTCDDSYGRHWTAYSRGNGTFYYKYHANTYRWCGHSGSRTQWADINGDGKADMICDDNYGRHWARLSSGFSFYGSIFNGANWCKGGITRYANWWWDTYHPKANDMMCDIGSYHFSRPAVGNGQFFASTYKLLSGGWCYAYYTHYADVNGNGVDDLICSYKGGHWLLAH